MYSICSYVCLSVCPSACLSICLSVHPSVCLSICLSVCLSVHLPVCLYVYLFVHLPVCLSRCLSICLDREEGYAAKVREEKKLKKYSGEVLHGGLSSKCVPLVFEHFGLWGSHAHKFLSHISRQSYNTTHAHPFNSAQRFKAFWRKQFSIILQRCNARVISRKLSRFSCSTNDSGIMFDCNVVGQVH